VHSRGSSCASLGVQTVTKEKCFALSTKCHSGLEGSRFPDRGSATPRHAVGVKRPGPSSTLDGNGRGPEMIRGKQEFRPGIDDDRGPDAADRAREVRWGSSPFSSCPQTGKTRTSDRAQRGLASAEVGIAADHDEAGIAAHRKAEEADTLAVDAA